MCPITHTSEKLMVGDNSLKMNKRINGYVIEGSDALVLRLMPGGDTILWNMKAHKCLEGRQVKYKNSHIF
jgi:hypothetical protein